MNPMDFLQLKLELDSFKANHPKFFPFLKAVSSGAVSENSMIEIQVTTPEGKNYATNLKLTKEDLELIGKLRNLQS